MKTKNKIAAVLMSVIMLITSFSITTFAAESITEFTEIKSGRTYQISSYEDLETLSMIVNENAYNCAGATFELMNNIIVNSDASSSKVLFMSFPDFRGTFNGKGHTISGLYIKGCGIFETLTNAEINDLKLNNAYIDMENSTSYPVGGIAGQISNSTVQNCSFKGTVINGGDYTGGIVGRAKGSSKVLNCTNRGMIFGKDYVSGIVGIADKRATISKCINLGTTYATGENNKGVFNSEQVTYTTQTGSCGTSAKYTLYLETGLLIISGTGKTTDYFTTINKSVFENNQAIKYVVIEDGITSIGDFLFSGCSNLEYVSIPNSVTRIGMGAFLECASLNELTISDKITSIGDPGSTIGKIMGRTVSPFSGCKQMMSFNIGKNNPNYSIGENGELYNKDKTVLIGYPSGNVSKTYVIPNSVKKLAFFAIAGNDYLEEIYIPKSVISSEEFAISFCPNIKNVYYDSTEENWNTISKSNSGVKRFEFPDGTVIHCTECNHSVIEESVVVEPTCIYEGYTTYQCVECGHKIHSDYVPKLPHNFVYDESITTRSVNEDGEIFESCTFCHSFRKVKVDKIKIDYSVSDKYISGMSAGKSEEELNAEISTAGFASFEITASSDNHIGTSSNITFTYDNGSSENYEVILYGDVNGDGWYDGQDAVIVNCLANGILSKDDVGEAAYKAADCNHDGVIDSSDVEILNQAGLILTDVDQDKTHEELIQTSSAYGEYLSLIDQSGDDEETDNPEKTPSVVEKIFMFIKNVIEYILCIIKL